MGNVYDYVKRVGRYAPMASAPYKGTEGSCSFSRYPNGLISQKVCLLSVSLKSSRKDKRYW